MRTFSRNLGDGSRCGVLSERERPFGDLDFCGVDTGLRPDAPSSAESCLLPTVFSGSIAEVSVSRQNRSTTKSAGQNEHIKQPQPCRCHRRSVGHSEEAGKRHGLAPSRTETVK